MLLVAAFLASTLPPGPAPLAPGADALHLNTSRPHFSWEPDSLKCDFVYVGAGYLSRVGDEVVVTDKTGGLSRFGPWRFPYGYSAYLLDGRIRIVNADGRLVAEQGVVIKTGAGEVDGRVFEADFPECFQD